MDKTEWQVLSPQITKKIGSANHKSSKCHIYGRSANLTNYLSLQIFGIAICEAYLRTAPVPTFGNHVPSKPTIVI
jgi:hypothetical protein